MNQRQKKKVFKKKYGYNPPSTKRQVDYVKVLSIAVNKIKEVMTGMVKQISMFMNNISKSIREMSEEEFNGKLKDLDIGQIAIVKRIRAQAKEDDING